jgi:hypothetical protein
VRSQHVQTCHVTIIIFFIYNFPIISNQNQKLSLPIEKNSKNMKQTAQSAAHEPAPPIKPSKVATSKTLTGGYMDSVISLYDTKRDNGVTEELGYVFILTTSMCLQHYNLFKLYFQDWNFKLIVYSF